jgi:hypothetical protein
MLNMLQDMEREIEMLENEIDSELELIRQEEIAEKRMYKIRNRLRHTRA